MTAVAIAELEIELTIMEGHCQRLRSRIEELKSEAISTTPSLPISTAVVVPTRSWKDICRDFPDFLVLLLPYIADRVIWNSISASTKDMYNKSQTIRPPWPEYYKLPLSCEGCSWSPCGTRIACVVGSNYTNIVTFDQRRGPLGYNDRNNNNNLGWEAHGGYSISDLKYSPDGRFLVSSGTADEYVRLWDSTRNYEQIQEWNMREEDGQAYMFQVTASISRCNKYIAVSTGNRFFLIDVEEGSIIKSVLLPDTNVFHNTTRFSSDGRAIFICVNNDNIAIMIWRPYLDDEDEDHLISLWRETGRRLDFFQKKTTLTFSHDNSLVAIHKGALIDKMVETEGTLWSIDMEHKSLTKKFDFQGSYGFHFTPDGKYIVVKKENGPILWSITEGKYTHSTIHFFDNGSNSTHHNKLVMKSLSPNNRQCIRQELGTGNRYITSYFVK